MADSLLVGHTQLTQKLTELVENFTLLDILSPEEQEELFSGKIDRNKQENEKRLLRQQEIEADRERASIGMPGLRSPREHQNLERESSSDSSKKSSSTGGERGSGWGPSKGHHSTPRPNVSAGTRADSKMSTSFSRRQVSSPVEPVPGMLQPNTMDIVLHNSGKGLGFGIIGTPVGVSIKTIVGDGAAAMEGTLRTGDTLLFVNDVDVRCMRRDEVFDILRRETGQVRLVVSREDEQLPPVGRGYSARRIDKEPDASKMESLRVTIPNDSQECIVDRDARTVKSCAQSLTVSIPNERAQGYVARGRGRGRTRGRGMIDSERSPKLTVEQIRQQECEEKRQQNIDLVEAEIKAMREAYEREKAAEEKHTAALPPPDPSPGGFLYDRSRFDPDLPQGTGPQDRREGRRRNPHNWGGPTIEDVQQTMSKTRQSRQQQSSGPASKLEMTVSMTGRERQDYEQWKSERDRVEQQRMARHVNKSGEWRREWDREKPVPTGRQDRSHAEGHQVSHYANRGGRHSGIGQGYGFRGGGRGRQQRNYNDGGRGHPRGGGSRNQQREGNPGAQRINIPIGKGHECLSPLSNPMDQWEPSGGEDWETAEDKILAESPKGPQGELWKPTSPNQDPLQGPIGTWEPLKEERQWEDDMENNKMSIGEKVQHWQDFGLLGPMPLDKEGNPISPAELQSSPGSKELQSPSGYVRVKTLTASGVEAAPIESLRGKGDIGGTEVKEAMPRLVERADVGDTDQHGDKRTGRKHAVKLPPLVIPPRENHPISPTSPLSAGSLKTPTDMVADWSLTPTDTQLGTLKEESSVYQFQGTASE